MRFASLLFTIMLFAQLGQQAQGVMVYNVVPRDIDVDYRIAGGTITANDALTIVTAWDIEVTGPVPFTFQNSLPDAEVSGQFNITPTDIHIDLVFVGVDRIDFIASDNSSPQCDDCFQFLSWGQDARIRYSQFDFTDGVPGFDVETPVNLPGGKTVVATAIPEPSAWILLLITSGVAATSTVVRHVAWRDDTV
jgi:hypothetical protein